MDHYLEVIVLPDPEFSEGMLMSAIFSKLHRALVDVAHGEIGVSFPHQKKTLGDCLRLHGTMSALNELMKITWLRGLRDYTHASNIQPVPSTDQHRIVQRVQVKSNAERLRRRSVKKGWLTEAEAAEKIQLSSERRSKLPFVCLKSNSNGEVFRLFIRQGALQHDVVFGKFSNYGLSGTTTIPYF